MEQEIKDCWRKARFSNTIGNYITHRQTARQRLIGRYKRFSRIALIMAVCSPLYVFLLLRNNTTASVWQITFVVVLIMIYCITASTMNAWIARGLSSINIAEWPVAEVCRRAFFYRKRHFQFITVLLPMCLIIIGLLGWILSDNSYFINGMASGAVIGAVVAIFVLRRFLKEYKDLSDDER